MGNGNWALGIGHWAEKFKIQNSKFKSFSPRVYLVYLVSPAPCPMTFRPPLCNCPDAVNKRQGNPGADSISLQVPSDWSAGFTGVKAIGGYCIHELAVLRIRKEVDEAFPNGIPKDLRTPEAVKMQREKIRYRLQIPNRLGDDFS